MTGFSVAIGLGSVVPFPERFVFRASRGDIEHLSGVDHAQLGTRVLLHVLVGVDVVELVLQLVAALRDRVEPCLGFLFLRHEVEDLRGRVAYDSGYGKDRENAHQHRKPVEGQTALFFGALLACQLPFALQIALRAALLLGLRDLRVEIGALEPRVALVLLARGRLHRFPYLCALRLAAAPLLSSRLFLCHRLLTAGSAVSLCSLCRALRRAAA